MAGGQTASGPRELIEREGELEQIDGALQAVAAGDGVVLVIEGAAGIGKTALLNAARERARRDGLTTLSARGGELERHFPYGVVRQLFEPALRGASVAARRRLLSGAAALAGPLVAGRAGATADGAVEADGSFGLIHSLYWLTLNICEQSPTLIVVDDLHWADGPSMRFLLYLAGRIEGVSLLLLAATRSGEAGAEPQLAARLGAEPRAQVLRPAPLSDLAVGRLVSDGLGRTPADSFASACQSATGGVPFLVYELVAALAADRIEPTDDHARLVREFGPRSVARATLMRLGRLPEGCLGFARAVAVLAADAQFRRAARLADLDEPQALRALDALAQAQVLLPGERLAFVHPILRAAIYDELPPAERSELHRRAADLLAAEGAELDTVAAQLLASEPTGSTRVIEQLREAATTALARGAPENAVAYLSRALREGCERKLQARLSFELAIATRLAGQPGAIKSLREALRLAGDPVLRSSAALELATVLGLAGRPQEPIELLTSAIEELGARDPALAIRIQSLLAGMTASDPRLVADFDRRLPDLEAVVERAEPPAHSLSLLLASIGNWRGGPVESVLALVERGWAGGEALSIGVDMWALGLGLGALVMSELVDRARALVDAILAHARERGSLLAFATGSAYGGWIEARVGHLDAAEEGLRQALGRSGPQLSFAVASRLWFATDVIVERPEAADLARLAESTPLDPIAGLFAGALLLDVRARVRHAAGDTSAAVEDLRRAGETLDALGFRNPNCSNWRSTLALMLAGSDRDDAKQLVEDELRDARRIGNARAIGVALRALGLVEGGAAGRARLEQAATTLEGSPARLEHARALLELGASMRRGGERAAARTPLRTSLDMAVAAGATRLAERAATELSASGARPRRQRMTGVRALTPSELRVARLAADGRTNNEIAQHLFVTPKTVDTHLSHVYLKLGISSRRSLAEALAQ